MMMRRLVLVGVALLSGASAWADAPKSTADVVSAVMPSVVMIQQRGMATDNGVPVVRDELGTGFIVDPSGLIVTNRHVIEGAFSISVDLSDGTHLPAKLVGMGTNFDIAVLKIDAGRPLQTVNIGDSDKLRVGDTVLAIGNPLGFTRTVTKGIVSAFNRDIGMSAYDDLIQSDASVNHGNSGGPLFNEAGEVIGINQAIHTQDGGGSIGISFAIPANQAKFVLQNIKQFGEPRIGWLGMGVSPLSAAMRKAIGLSGTGGAIVSSVTPDSPAARAGMQVGDVVEAFNKTAIPDTSTLNRSVAVSAGQPVTLSVIRGGKTVSVPAMIGSLAGSSLWVTSLPPAPRLQSIGALGMIFGGDAADGVRIADVVRGSVAWATGIRPGDVLQKIDFNDVRTVDDLQRLFAKYSSDGKSDAIVLVSNGSGARWTNLSLTEW